MQVTIDHQRHFQYEHIHKLDTCNANPKYLANPAEDLYQSNDNRRTH